MTKSDPLAALERVQATLVQADAPLDKLEKSRLDLQRIIADGEAELVDLGARRKIELLAPAPAAALDKALDALDRNERAAARRVEVAKAVLDELGPRIASAREVELEVRRRSNYDTAVRLHSEATTIIRNFLDNVGPAARAALEACAESEAATAAANKALPPGCLPIPTIEQERQSAAPPPKIVERTFRAFTSGGRFVAEHGSIEASPGPGGTWTLFFPSASIQGGETVGGCVLEDFVDIRIERFEPSRPATLASSLSIPAFHAPGPARGSVEKKRMKLADWRAINGEPIEAETELA